MSSESQFATTSGALQQEVAHGKPHTQENELKVMVENPHPLKPIPPRVLQEEDYTEAVSTIIERDFFPDLPHLRIRHELQQAHLTGNEMQVRAAHLKLANLARPTPLSMPDATPNCTPHVALLAASSSAGQAGGQHPNLQDALHLSAWERDDDMDSTATGLPENSNHAILRLANGKAVAMDLAKVRLDDFQRVFTSEDNASFEAILAKDRERLCKKEWWIEHAESEHNLRYKERVRALEQGGSLESGIMMGNEFKARNALSFFKSDLPQEKLEVPRVEFKNTRFTTKQYTELEESVSGAVVSRKARLEGGKVADVQKVMEHDGPMNLSMLTSSHHTRAIGGRLQSPLAADVNGYKFVRTPPILPGFDGVSPLMTYGKIASTPRVLGESANGPTFSMADQSDRDLAAEKLYRGAVQSKRESKQATRAERLRALGLTPSGTPAKTITPSSGIRPTPGSVQSKLTPLSPIGQLLHRAQKLAQKGGRLHIGTSRNPVHPSPSLGSGPPAKRARTHNAQETSGTPASSELPPSITDNLLLS